MKIDIRDKSKFNWPEEILILDDEEFSEGPPEFPCNHYLPATDVFIDWLRYYFQENRYIDKETLSAYQVWWRIYVHVWERFCSHEQLILKGETLNKALVYYVIWAVLGYTDGQSKQVLRITSKLNINVNKLLQERSDAEEKTKYKPKPKTYTKEEIRNFNNKEASRIQNLKEKIKARPNPYTT